VVLVACMVVVVVGAPPLPVSVGGDRPCVIQRPSVASELGTTGRGVDAVVGVGSVESRCNMEGGRPKQEQMVVGTNGGGCRS
jgi:hypothetical protein